MNTVLHPTLLRWLTGDGRAVVVTAFRSTAPEAAPTVASDLCDALVRDEARAVVANSRALRAALAHPQRLGGPSPRSLLDAPLTHLVDLSGCYLPGQGAPLAVLLSDPAAAGERVRVVRCNHGEPRTPAALERGLVWRSVLDACDVLRSDQWACSWDFARDDAAGALAFLTTEERWYP